VAGTAMVTALTADQLDYIWANLRESDRAELAVCGRNDSNYRDYLTECTDQRCGLVDGEPVCMFGYTVAGSHIWVGFIATDRCEQWWKTITKVAHRYLSTIQEVYPDHTISVAVHDQHITAQRWLRHLRFDPTGEDVVHPTGRVLIMERRRQGKYR